VDEQKYEGEHVISGFASYFEKLATPKDNPSFDAAYDKQIKLDIELLSQIPT
jgi:hypothetical protein